VHLGRGLDIITLRNDGQPDRINCGRGDDSVTYYGMRDHHDTISPDCETVSVVPR